MENISLIILLVILALIVRESRAGRQIVTADPSIQLKPSERFRTLRMQMLEPLVAVVVVGSLLVTDLERAHRGTRSPRSSAPWPATASARTAPVRPTSHPCLPTRA